MKEDTNTSKFDKKDTVYSIIIILLLCLGVMFYRNTVKNLNDRFDNYENTIKALNDSIHVVVKNGLTEYSKLTPEMNIEDLVKSEYFKTLSADQQKYYNELNKIKGLIASTKADISKQGSDLANLINSAGTVVTDSTGTKICYHSTDTLLFAQQDTSKALKWNGQMYFNTATNQFKPDFKLTYDYKFKIQTDFIRQKDKSILVTWKIDDPELKVNKMNNFIIPVNEKRTKLGRWFEKNKKTFVGVGLGAAFVGGGILGFKIAQ